MNNIITLPKLTELLAEVASVDIDTAKSFINDLTSTISEALKTEYSVTIKGLGTFNKIEKDDSIKIQFAPDNEISEAINAPFLFFEPVQLAEEITNESFSSIGKSYKLQQDVDVADDNSVVNNNNTANADEDNSAAVDVTGDNSAANVVGDNNAVNVTSDNSAVNVADDDNAVNVADENSAANFAGDNSAANVAGDNSAANVVDDNNAINVADDNNAANTIDDNNAANVVDVNTDNTENDEDDEYDEDTMKLPWFTISLVFIIGILVGFGLGFFGHDYIQGKASKPLPETPLPVNDVIPTDTLASDTTSIDLSEATEDVIDTAHSTTENKVQTTNANKPKEESAPTNDTNTSTGAVYDVVKPGSDLNSLALKHYKIKEYWVYIYEANKDKIKNPNNVMSGTRLVIPPKSQCDVSNDDAKNRQAAKDKSAQILRQFEKR